MMVAIEAYQLYALKLYKLYLISIICIHKNPRQTPVKRIQLQTKHELSFKQAMPFVIASFYTIGLDGHNPILKGRFLFVCLFGKCGITVLNTNHIFYTN